jgi:hypothetical protein
VGTHGGVIPVNPKKSPILTAYRVEFKPALFKQSVAAAAAAAVRFGWLRTLTGNIFLGAALEVGFVPAAAFQTEAGRRNFFDQLGFAARRAMNQRLVAELLQGFVFMPAGLALIFVNWHGIAPVKKQ